MAKQKLQLMESKAVNRAATALTDEDVVPLKIAYIGGGSRGWAHALMKDLLLYPGFTGEVRLYDIDRPMAELNQKYATWLQGHPQAATKFKYRVTATLKAALKDADFVFASILPGPINYMKHDIEEPKKYGIFLPVGDTVGPGGTIRALRAIRDYRVIGEAIGKYAPDAWVLNFTNPMSICTRTLYEAHPGAKAYGCCHEVFGSQEKLANIYAQMTGNPAPPRREIDVNVLGINHFTWIDKAQYRKTDLMAMLHDYMKKTGTIRKYSQKEVDKTPFVHSSFSQVAYELTRRYGIMGAAGDRHLAEFVPWFLTGKDSCYRWGFKLTPFSFRLNRYINAPKHFRKILRKGAFPELSCSGEEYINQMRAISGGTPLKTNVNLPNRGQVSNLPSGAVVETNAYFSTDNVQPVMSGALPDNVQSLVLPHVHNQESLVKAVFTDDKELAFQAFLNDPLVNIGMDDAWKLFNTMLRKTNFAFGKQTKS